MHQILKEGKWEKSIKYNRQWYMYTKNNVWRQLDLINKSNHVYRLCREAKMWGKEKTTKSLERKLKIRYDKW